MVMAFAGDRVTNRAESKECAFCCWLVGLGAGCLQRERRLTSVSICIPIINSMFEHCLQTISNRPPPFSGRFKLVLFRFDRSIVDCHRMSSFFSNKSNGSRNTWKSMTSPIVLQNGFTQGFPQQNSVTKIRRNPITAKLTVIYLKHAHSHTTSTKQKKNTRAHLRILSARTNTNNNNNSHTKIPLFLIIVFVCAHLVENFRAPFLLNANACACVCV